MELEQESNINFIPCVKWVTRGVASTNPTKVQLSKEELIEVINSTKNKLQISTNNENGETSTEGTSSNSQDQYNFENYDNDDEDNNTAKLLGISSLAELSNETEENFSDSDDSEKEDDLIKPTDNLILVGHVEGDASILEVHVYNEEDESLYVHHDIFLPSFPLCLEWLNYEPKMPKGSYCAIGTMSPIIEVWDLDLVNSVEPSFRLGQLANRKKQKSQIGHKDAVLALAWNKNFDHVMASGSVDKTILLWDMENKKPNTTISSFDDKVQCLEWHRLEAQTLLAGGCDNKARIFDCRSTETHQTWSLNGEAERLLWHPLKPFSFIAGTSNGTVQCFDCRQGQIWEIQAHEKEVTGLAVSSQCPGLLLTASTDELVKIWDCQEESTPVIVTEINFGIGQVHCLELCPDSPFVITAGGDKKSNNFTVYDLRNNDVVKNKFESRELIQLVTEDENMEENTN